MKKTILTAIALLCLQTPLQAQDDVPCSVIGVPCYIKSNTILSEKPSEDSPIVYQVPSAGDSDRLYFFRTSSTEVKGKWWSFFEPVTPFIDMSTGKKMAGGWAPVDNAFLDIYEPSVEEFGVYGGQPKMFMVRPGVPIYLVETKNAFIMAPALQIVHK